MHIFYKIKDLIIISGVSLFLILSVPVYAARIHHEKYYQEEWCREKGDIEIVLPDKTRCDCLTAEHAIEFDFGDKWCEAIGQALYYSLQTGKKAGIVLILESKKDQKYWIRLNTTIQHFGLPIDTWKVEP